MSNTASSINSSQSSCVPVFINEELVMLDKSTLNALKAMAYDQSKTVEQIMNEAITETMADPARMARVVERCKADNVELSH